MRMEVLIPTFTCRVAANNSIVDWAEPEVPFSTLYYEERGRIVSVVTPMTLGEIASLPATVDIITAARAFGLGKRFAYESANAGTFPVSVIRVGRGPFRVPTVNILDMLGTGVIAMLRGDQTSEQQPATSPLDEHIDQIAHDPMWRENLSGVSIPDAMAEQGFDEGELHTLLVRHIQARLEPTGLLDVDYDQDGQPEPEFDRDLFDEELES